MKGFGNGDGIERGCDDGDLNAARCKELGHVDDGNHVAVSHEWEQEDVELSVFAAHGG